jgi:hypothetical protein
MEEHMVIKEYGNTQVSRRPGGEARLKSVKSSRQIRPHVCVSKN